MFCNDMWYNILEYVDTESYINLRLVIKSTEKYCKRFGNFKLITCFSGKKRIGHNNKYFNDKYNLIKFLSSKFDNDNMYIVQSYNKYYNRLYIITDLNSVYNIENSHPVIDFEKYIN